MFGHSFLFILAVLALGLFCSRYLRPFLDIALKKIARFFPKEISSQFLKQPKTAYSLLILWLICFIGFSLSPVEERWEPFIYSPLRFVLAYSLLILSWQFLDLLESLIAKKFRDKALQAEAAGAEEDSITKRLLPYSKKILKSLTAVIAILIFLQNSGVNVTSLLAGLGLGGIAVALAAKETLRDFFGGFSVMADRAFFVGDWIVCGEVEGTVEDIGFRSTKIKTFYDSVLTIPNSVIADSVIDNLGKRKARRTRATLGLTYDAPPEKITAFVEGARQIIKSNPYARKDYYQCYFSGYGPHSLEIFLNFFLKVKDWDTELEQKQNIFLEILKLAKRLDLKFAYPTQTLDIPALSGQKKAKRPES